jgi:hypothetical protein
VIKRQHSLPRLERYLLQYLVIMAREKRLGNEAEGKGEKRDNEGLLRIKSIRA